jgi:transposase
MRFSGKEAAVEKKYRVTLTPGERAELNQLIRAGKSAARKLTHARIVLLADQAQGGPARSISQITEALGVSKTTVCRVRERFVEEGLEAALVRKPTSRVYARKLDGRGEAHLVALACSQPPEGRVDWTLQLLADQMVVMQYADELSIETVRRVLKKTRPNRG